MVADPTPQTLAVVGGRDVEGAPVAAAVRGGRIVAGELSVVGCDRLDAGGSVVASGFVDLQVNGAVGIDLTHDPDGLWSVAEALPRFGVTSFCPTLVSPSDETVRHARAVLAAGPSAGWRGARPLGWHVEGPMLNPARRGAHLRGRLRPPAQVDTSGWSPEGGIAMVTLAPELPGAHAVVRELSSRGVLVAAGHTEATAADARHAADSGARVATHLFNAMAPAHHRAPGLVGAVLSRGCGLAATLIADGRHVDPEMIAVAWRCLRPDGLALVSDAIAGLGAPPGRFSLAGLGVVVDERGARGAEGELAGAVDGLDAGLRNLVRFAGCGLSDALATVSSTPARLLRRDDLGVLRPGARGDIVLLDDDLRVVATVVGGQVVFDRRSTPT